MSDASALVNAFSMSLHSFFRKYTKEKQFRNCVLNTAICMYAKKNAREEEARKVINELLKDQTERIASELNENELENLFMHVQNEVRTFAFPPEAVGEEET